MSTTKTLADLKTWLGRTTAMIEQELTALRQRITGTRKARNVAEHAPLRVEDIVGTKIPAAVAEAGAAWLRERGSSLIHGEQSLGHPTWAGSTRLPWSYLEAPSWGAWCASDPAGAAEFLSNLVRQVTYEAGPPSAERPALIARLDAELAELEAAEEAMVDAMGAEGLIVAHRPEVVQRREAEARRRERAAQSAAARAEQEAAINRAHAEAAAAPRAVRSPYLEANRPRRGGDAS